MNLFLASIAVCTLGSSNGPIFGSKPKNIRPTYVPKLGDIKRTPPSIEDIMVMQACIYSDNSPKILQYLGDHCERKTITLHEFMEETYSEDGTPNWLVALSKFPLDFFLHIPNADEYLFRYHTITNDRDGSTTEISGWSAVLQRKHIAFVFSPFVMRNIKYIANLDDVIIPANNFVACSASIWFTIFGFLWGFGGSCDESLIRVYNDDVLPLMNKSILELKLKDPRYREIYTIKDDDGAWYRIGEYWPLFKAKYDYLMSD